ncbi:MAG TPA: hypothetical protein VIV11_30360 [Kofleriaceae bacterium]
MRLVLVALAGLVGCGDSNSDCARAVRHVFDLTTKVGKPGAEEQAVIDQIARQTTRACEREGLSAAQRDCILAAKALDDRQFLMCPALVAKKPSWIIAPIGHPEVLDEIDQIQAEPVDVDQLDKK